MQTQVSLENENEVVTESKKLPSLNFTQAENEVKDHSDSNEELM